MRRLATIVAVVCVGFGAVAAVTGWHPGSAVPLLLLGILRAVAALAAGRARRS